MYDENSPIIIRPLTLRGVFGITNAVMKRGIWGVTGFTLLYGAVATLLILLSVSPVLPLILRPDPQAATIVSSVMLCVIFVLLASLFIWLVVNPIFAGTLYGEMSARVYGRGASCGELLKRSRFALKRFFTLNLCHSVAQWAVQFIISLVTSTLTSVLMVGSVFTAVFSALSGGAGMDPEAAFDLMAGTFSAGMIAPMIIVWLLAMAAGVCGAVPLLSVYPVAVNEGAKNFAAVSRSIKLGFKRFGRILAALALYMLITLGISLAMGALFVLVAFLGKYAPIPAVALEIALGLVWFVLMAMINTYSAALATVLYFDARVRLEGENAMGYAHGGADNAADNGYAGPGGAYEQEQPGAQPEPEFVPRNDGEAYTGRDDDGAM